MNQKYRFTAVLLALLCSANLVVPALASGTEEENAPAEAAYFGSSDIPLKGLFVESLNNRDYPAMAHATAAVMSGYADEIVSFAKEYQFNTLFYEVSPRADAAYRSNYLPSSRFVVEEEGSFILSDPLDVLTETADMEKINVALSVSVLYAGEVNDHYADDSPVVQHPEWFITQGNSLYFDPNNEQVRDFWVSVVTELCETYGIDGIMFRGLDELGSSYAGGITLLIDDCTEAIHRINNQLSVGISLPHSAVEDEAWKLTISAISDQINFVIPEMDVAVQSETSYSDYLSMWTKLLENSAVRLYTANQANRLCYPLTDSLVYGDERELSYQLYANVAQGADGYVLHSYSDLSGLRSNIAQELTLVPEDVTNAESLLTEDRPAELSLADENSSVSTIYTRYYLSGRCDPTKPLYLNGEEVDSSNITPNGFWGLTVELNRGINHFSVRQDSKTKRIAIHSTINNPQIVTEISDIQEDSVYPQGTEILFEGETMVLSCIAPYGGEVMAMFHNDTYHLLPPEGLTEADKGKAVEYRLEIIPESMDSAQTTELGQVNYFLTYDNFSSKYRSAGSIYLVGSSSRLAVEVTDTVGRVYQSLEDDKVISNLPKGATDYAYVSSNPEFYRLYSGGYISKKDVKIIEGIVDIQHSIEAVGIQSTDQGENLIFVGGAGLPHYTSFSQSAKTLFLQLNNIVNVPASLFHLSSELFDSISVINDEQKNTSTIRFHLAEGKQLWGYQVTYDEGNLYLKCKTAPLLSNDPLQPLKGVSFVIDAEHGGIDKGSKTVWGSNGPLEKDITLAYAQSLRRRLESLGAEVYLTRADDSAMDEEDRILYSAYKNADFYLSFCGTATTENQNGWSATGISIGYDNELSYQLGYDIYGKLADELRLEINEIFGNEPAITKVPLAKPLIISPGVLTNPLDYERMTDPVEIYRTSCVLADLLIDYLKKF